MNRKRLSYRALISLTYGSIILSQAFLFASKLALINIVNDRILLKNPSELLRGNIFFTGELSGIVSGCADCQAGFSPLPKAAAIIRNNENYLYFDLGDFTSGGELSNKREIYFYRDFFGYLSLSAINLTIRDFASIHNTPYDKLFNFVSLNVLPKLPEVVHTAMGKFPLQISNTTLKGMASIAVTGMSENRRMAGATTQAVENKNQAQALANLSNMDIPGKVFIVLYHDSEFNLRKFFSNYKGPRITLIVGCYGSTVTDNIKHIGKIPYVYIGNRGKYLGHMTLFFNSQRFHSFSFRPIKINEDYPDDINVTNMANISNNIWQRMLICQ